MTGRICAWCRGPIPTAARRDAVCCSVRCRQNAWEPVIYWGGRRDASRSTMAGEKVSRRPGERVVEDLPDASRDTGAPRPVASAGGNDASRRAAANASLVAAADASLGSARRVDVLAYRPGARTTEPGRVVGAKPAAFCRWVFDLLGAEPQDQFDDLFAGSGGVARAWSVFSGTYTLPAVREVPA